MPYYQNDLSFDPDRVRSLCALLPGTLTECELLGWLEKCACRQRKEK